MIAIIILLAENMAEWDFLFEFVLIFLVNSEEEESEAEKGEKSDKDHSSKKR